MREWTISRDHAERNQFKAYAKKHGREVASCLANLQTLVDLLNDGITLDQAASTRFFSSEGGGLFRIGQTGVPHAKETRLYLFVRIVAETIEVLTIGDKSSQRKDIQRCRVLIRRIEKEPT